MDVSSSESDKGSVNANVRDRITNKRETEMGSRDLIKENREITGLARDRPGKRTLVLDDSDEIKNAQAEKKMPMIIADELYKAMIWDSNQFMRYLEEIYRLRKSGSAVCLTCHVKWEKGL